MTSIILISQQEGRRALRVGPNKGEVFPEEVAELLESKSLLRPERLDLCRIDHDTDVLIIGAGGAGTSAALMASQAGAKVIMVTKLRHGDANTMMAEGGIQGYYGPGYWGNPWGGRGYGRGNGRMSFSMDGGGWGNGNGYGW